MQAGRQMYTGILIYSFAKIGVYYVRNKEETHTKGSALGMGLKIYGIV